MWNPSIELRYPVLCKWFKTVLWSMFSSIAMSRDEICWSPSICLKNFIDFFNDWPARARFIFNIEISRTKTSKPILALGFTKALITINTTQLSMSLRYIFPFSEVKKQNMTKMTFWNLHFRSVITFDCVNE